MLFENNDSRLSQDFTNNSLVDVKFSNSYFTDECLFPFERTDLNNSVFKICNDQEGESSTKVISDQQMTFCNARNIDFSNFEKENEML